MQFLSLVYIKMHSRIDFSCDDPTLEEYGDAAEETLAGLLNRGKTVEKMVESLVEEYGKIPAAIYVAGQQLVEQQYDHKSSTSPQHMSIVPYGFDLLIKPYMKL